MTSRYIHHHTERRRSDCESVWVCIDEMCLHVQDKDIILHESRQTYECHSKALEETVYFHSRIHTTLKVTIESYTAWIPDYLQFFHTRGDHWITLTIMGCNQNNIFIFDSLYDHVDTATKSAVEMIFLEAFHANASNYTYTL